MRKTVVTAATALSAMTSGSVAGAADAGSPVAGGESHFVQMDRIETPIFSPSRIEGSFQLSLVLEAKDAAAASAMQDEMPRLRAASLAATLEFARLYASELTAVDAERLSADVTASLKRVNPGIARVLIVKVAALPVA
ncbi:MULTISPECIES: hypothetical protein [Sphingomonadales]|uniref:Flagellar protein FliL n=2 Tax=Edaphosphingomonas TaxID=3423724 RepID=A0A2T4HPI2_9SPHN|nr:MULTISPECIES: hypothetical protein [Sphingomonas]AGH49086.1 hypothetical protein G432_06805 [Sphingomonas sp. MM-1]MDX3883684.1 hypothetical protein [Sphingomonas sp.]OHT21507.1 hypothetical protein BHE75_03515 [Sphingomonas haloaromaticamans]PTD17688.1 hypothetical protein CV103_17015 [Sphingomonas fennica]